MDRAGILILRQKEGKQHRTQLDGAAEAVTLLILLTLTKDESISKKKYNIEPRWTVLQ